MIQQFKPMKLKEINDLNEIKDLTNKVYQQKIDGGNWIVDVELPVVKIYHARDDVWHNRTYQYPDMVRDIQNGSLQDKQTYIGEGTVWDEHRIGRRHLLGHRLVENPFQINRMAKLCPVRFYPHHIVRRADETLFHVTYEQQLRMLEKSVHPTEQTIFLPSYETPDELIEWNIQLKQKGTHIEGFVIKDLSGTYQVGKTSYSMWKRKFLKEAVLRYISYQIKDVGINLFTEDEIEVHLADPMQIPVAMANIDERGFVKAETTFLEKTAGGKLRDARIKRLLIEAM